MGRNELEAILRDLSAEISAVEKVTTSIGQRRASRSGHPIVTPPMPTATGESGDPGEPGEPEPGPPVVIDEEPENPFSDDADSEAIPAMAVLPPDHVSDARAEPAPAPAPDEMRADDPLDDPVHEAMTSPIYDAPAPERDLPQDDDPIDPAVDEARARALVEEIENDREPANNDGSLSDLWTPEDEPTGEQPRQDLGDRLVADGVITPAALATARGVESKTSGRSLVDILVDTGADEAKVREAYAASVDLPFLRIDPETIDERYLHRLGVEFCKQASVMPLHMTGARLVLGMIRPDLMLIDEIRMKLGVSVKPVIVCQRDIASILEAHREEEAQDVEVDDIIAGIEEDDVEVVQAKEEQVDLEKMAGESPVIRFVNYLIFNAVKEGASDIHIEPQEKRLQVRYRIDGVLFEMMNPPHTMHAAIISRLKIMANLDISERRLPQDGRIRAMVHGRKLDLRLSTLPTAQGEKAVMRILDTRSIQVSLDDLGMGEDTLTLWRNQIAQPHGILLVTGPTGSGKTTTLYSSLGQMDRSRLNISTVEDPVEYHLAGISQTQTHERIGMTFAAALRALLRQDPDVVMVGEIRDVDTATIAIQASLTGHLVLSTLHTNDAPSAVTRLINIGVEPFLIGAALNAVLAQRLVRRICPHCGVQTPPNDVFAEHLAMHGVAIDEVWVGQGCDKCRSTGYLGRVGMYELLVLDDMLRDRIAQNPSVTEFRRTCIERGMVTLREDGFQKVASGKTTVDEVLRVTESTI